MASGHQLTLLGVGQTHAESLGQLTGAAAVTGSEVLSRAPAPQTLINYWVFSGLVGNRDQGVYTGPSFHFLSPSLQFNPVHPPQQLLTTLSLMPVTSPISEHLSPLLQAFLLLAWAGKCTISDLISTRHFFLIASQG